MSVMPLDRRQLIQIAAGNFALSALSRSANASAYPDRPVRLVVGFPAGGPTDLAARIAAQWLSEHLGQPFVVENRPGAGSNIATESVIRSPPDGYTLLLAASANAINATAYSRLAFNFVEDVAPVAGIMQQPFAMVANPTVPAVTLPQFIAYARSNPGKIAMASAGNGTPHHAFGELFKMMTGLELLHVPYRGEAPALTDLLGGQVQMMFGSVSGTIGYIKAAKLTALAVTSATRARMLPDVPPVADFVPGFEANAWLGIAAPRSTPENIVGVLNDGINRCIADPGIRERLSDLGGAVLPGSPQDFGRLIADDTKKWAKVVARAGIRID